MHHFFMVLSDNFIILIIFFVFYSPKYVIISRFIEMIEEMNMHFYLFLD